MRCGVTWLGLGMGLAGCGTSASVVRTEPVTNVSTAKPERPLSEAERVTREAMQLWARRQDPAVHGQALALFRRAAELEPGRAEGWAKLAAAHDFLARRARLGGDLEGAAAHRRGGLEAAGRALPELGPNRLESIATITADQAAALYWYAVHAAAGARLSGFGAVVTTRALALAALERARELDPMIDHAGPDRELGRLRARATSPIVRDLAAAAEHFDRAIELAPGYLDNHLARAAEHSVRAQDRAGFERELRSVMEGPLADDDAEPDNRMARHEAQALLERAGELFE